MSFEPQVVDHPEIGRLTLDWRLRYDQKSLLYKISDHFYMDRPLMTHHWTVRHFLNQGDTPGCTGWSFTQIMDTVPHAQGLTDSDALNRYRRAQQIDEWPGEDYEGSSVLGAQDSAKADGLITAYYWATTLEELKRGVGYHGPMQIGSEWFEGMFSPDSDYYIKPTGSSAGGHAYEVSAYEVNTDSFWIANTWGPDWGFGGIAKIRADDLGSLVFSGSGEAALPFKKVVRTRT